MVGYTICKVLAVIKELERLLTMQKKIIVIQGQGSGVYVTKICLTSLLALKPWSEKSKVK